MKRLLLLTLFSSIFIVPSFSWAWDSIEITNIKYMKANTGWGMYLSGKKVSTGEVAHYQLLLSDTLSDHHKTIISLILAAQSLDEVISIYWNTNSEGVKVIYGVNKS